MTFNSPSNLLLGYENPELHGRQFTERCALENTTIAKQEKSVIKLFPVKHSKAESRSYFMIKHQVPLSRTNLDHYIQAVHTQILSHEH